MELNQGSCEGMAELEEVQDEFYSLGFMSLDESRQLAWIALECQWLYREFGRDAVAQRYPIIGMHAGWIKKH